MAVTSYDDVALMLALIVIFIQAGVSILHFLQFPSVDVENNRGCNLCVNQGDAVSMNIEHMQQAWWHYSCCDDGDGDEDDVGGEAEDGDGDEDDGVVLAKAGS